MPCTHPLEKRVQLEKFRIRFYPETLLRTISWEGKSSDSSEQSKRGKGRTRIYTSFCRKKKKCSQISNDYHYSQKTDPMLKILVLFWVWEGARPLAH